MASFLWQAYIKVEYLNETVPGFRIRWAECLGYLAGVRVAIEDKDVQSKRDAEIQRYWRTVSLRWYAEAAERSPETGKYFT